MSQHHINHYGILRIPRTATKDEIIYRLHKELFFRFHPDKVLQKKGRPVTKVEKNRWNDINNSWSVLVNDDLRDKYNKFWDKVVSDPSFLLWQ